MLASAPEPRWACFHATCGRNYCPSGCGLALSAAAPGHKSSVRPSAPSRLLLLQSGLCACTLCVQVPKDRLEPLEKVHSLLVENCLASAKLSLQELLDEQQRSLNRMPKGLAREGLMPDYIRLKKVKGKGSGQRLIWGDASKPGSLLPQKATAPHGRVFLTTLATHNMSSTRSCILHNHQVFVRYSLVHHNCFSSRRHRSADHRH
jgi:hypothetical protein